MITVPQTNYVIPTNEVWLSVVTHSGGRYPPNKQFHLHWDSNAATMRLKRKYYGKHLTGDVYRFVDGAWVLYGTVASGEFFPAKSAPSDKFLIA